MWLSEWGILRIRRMNHKQFEAIDGTEDVA